MSKYLFNIRNLSCQYPSNHHPVLKIDELKIEPKKIYFMVGPSGVGKSTLLETLGLMNKTALSESATQFDYSANGEELSLLKLWEKRESEIAAFRKAQFSFIFQSTNLFENLSAYENAAITQVLQGEDLPNAFLKARQLLIQTFETDIAKEIVEGKKVEKMSGGQRQRLAFVRAMGASFNVLLADEPTGNLDAYNAKNLIGLLRKTVLAKNATAIIVSHDIDLACQFGDQIVYLEKKTLAENSADKTYFGLVDRYSIYNRSKNGEFWGNPASGEIPHERLAEFLKDKLTKEIAAI